MQAPAHVPKNRRGSNLRRALLIAKIDFAPKDTQPAATRLLFATVVSLLGSLAIDTLLVAIGTRVFPSTKGFAHFQFSD
jgi:hypothetical protein